MDRRVHLWTHGSTEPNWVGKAKFVKSLFPKAGDLPENPDTQFKLHDAVLKTVERAAEEPRTSPGVVGAFMADFKGAYRQLRLKNAFSFVVDTYNVMDLELRNPTASMYNMKLTYGGHWTATRRVLPKTYDRVGLDRTTWHNEREGRTTSSGQYRGTWDTATTVSPTRG